MARILICHVPKDGSTARELGGALMGRGHFVSFDGEPDAHRADRSARLRQFEAVIVVWTEASYQSAGLAQIARETLPLNLLVSVRSETLDIARLPLVFRKLNMFAPRDVDGLARLVARLSTAATSLKEMAEHSAKFETEPRRELPPIVPKPARKLEPLAQSAEAELAGPSGAPANALPPPIISAEHAQYTVRIPVHFDLPDVTDGAGADAAQPPPVAKPAQPAAVARPPLPVFVTRPAQEAPAPKPAQPASATRPPLPVFVTRPAQPAPAKPAQTASATRPPLPVFVARPPAQPATVTEPTQPVPAIRPQQPAFVARPAEPVPVTRSAQPPMSATEPAQPAYATKQPAFGAWPAQPATFARPAQPASATRPAPPESLSKPAAPAYAVPAAQPVFVAKSVQPAPVAMPYPSLPPQLAPQVSAPVRQTEMQQLRAALQPNAQRVAERQIPIPASQSQAPSPYSAIANAQDLSDAIEAGLLLHYIPEMMWLGEAGTVEVRLDRNVLEQFFGPADRLGGASAIERLSLSLYGTADAFEIDRLSERTQFVGGPGIPGDSGHRWEWHVTPRTPGTQDLVVRVSALLLDRHGVPAPVALPDRRFRVDVDAREGARVMSSLSGWFRR